MGVYNTTCGIKPEAQLFDCMWDLKRSMYLDGDAIDGKRTLRLCHLHGVTDYDPPCTQRRRTARTPMSPLSETLVGGGDAASENYVEGPKTSNEVSANCFMTDSG